MPVRIGTRRHAAGGPLMRSMLVPFLALLLVTAFGCSRQGSQPTKSGLRIVTTTAMIADAARNVAGKHAEVIALMGQGVDPHVYKASPGDVRTLESADLILYNGLHLEGRMADTLAQLGKRRRVVAVAEAIPHDLLRNPPEFEGQHDPHVWFDPTLWKFVADRVRDAMIETDPSHEAEYRANAAKYATELDGLHAWTKAQISTIPEQGRVLITAHDAFGYFGRAFGLEVLGIQGISTDSETSLDTVRSLVTLLSDRKIPAVFVESSVPRKSIEALIEGAKARGHSLTIGGELFSDAMGPEGTPEGTYLGMVRHNVVTIVKALGGTVTDSPVQSPASTPAPTTDGAPKGTP